MIMISGPLRSGTTILQRVVATAAHSNGFTPELRGPYVAYSDGARRLDGKRVIRRAIRAEIVKFWNEQGRPQILIGKDPMITVYISRFVRLTPKVKHIISVRDPRDVIRSALSVRQRMLEDDNPPINAITSYTEIGLVDYVMNIYRAISAIEDRPNVMISRYERLAAKDESLRRDLSIFIGSEISYSPAAISASHPEDKYYKTSVSGQEISSSRVGNNQSLPAVVERELGRHQDIIEHFGYSRAAKP
jgi:hypothetical protein